MIHKRFNVDGHKWIVEEYSLFSELIDLIKSRPHLHNKDNLNDKYSESFVSVRNFSEAEDLLVNGWSEYVPALQREIRKNKTLGTEVKRIRIENSRVGFAPIVPKALLGHPDSMLDIRIRPIKMKVIHLIYDITSSCFVNQKDILRVGIALVKTIIKLEQKGYRVRLQAAQSYSDSASADMLLMNIKNENQPLDLKRIMFPLIHPAMFRGIGFAWWERCPETEYKSAYGHLMSKEYGLRKTKEYVKTVFGDHVNYISCGELTEYNDETIEKKIISQF